MGKRSGWVSLDLPKGAIETRPGGVGEHHVTIVYLGRDIDDKAFAAAQLRATASARAIGGPLAGRIGGAIRTFEPSPGSNGKTVAYTDVAIPGIERLYASLADLSASGRATHAPHVTLAYLDESDESPPAPPSTEVVFTHLSVHRGDDVAHIPFMSQGDAAP